MFGTISIFFVLALTTVGNGVAGLSGCEYDSLGVIVGNADGLPIGVGRAIDRDWDGEPSLDCLHACEVAQTLALGLGDEDTLDRSWWYLSAEADGEIVLGPYPVGRVLRCD